jgi:hypothetical protein
MLSVKMGRVTKKDEPAKCQIVDCVEEAVRSMPTKKLTEVFDNDQIETGNRRTKLCKKHYREYKKATKKDRKLDALGREF